MLGKIKFGVVMFFLCFFSNFNGVSISVGFVRDMQIYLFGKEIFNLNVCAWVCYSRVRLNKMFYVWFVDYSDRLFVCVSKSNERNAVFNSPWCDAFPMCGQANACSPLQSTKLFKFCKMDILHHYLG